MQHIPGLLTPVVIYLLIFLLNVALPGRWVTGYVTRTGSTEKLRYHLNGLLVLFTTVATWALLCYTGVLPWDWLYQYRWQSLIGAVIIGLIFSFAVVLPHKPARSFLADFYLGRALNLQLWGGRIDAKMWLYLVGAVMLQLNVLSFAAHHYFQFGAQASAGYFLSTALLTFFLIDYLTFEEVHLYTYDLFAERVGFKLGWGCLAFYPFFYAIPQWSTVNAPVVQMPWYILVLCALVFFTGWGLSRGANLQKFFFKLDPNKKFLGIQPETVTDGKGTLLVNGFWGLSRHINYLGEILMATGIVLCVAYAFSPLPWLYPFYYVVLLFPRQLDDDKRCADKYGALWIEYCKRVPRKIIPGIY